MGGIYYVYNRGYDSGVSHERTVWEKRIEKENKENRVFEEEIQDAVNEVGEKYILETKERVIVEKQHELNIEEYLKEHPEYLNCTIDEKIIEELNKLGAIVK